MIHHNHLIIGRGALALALIEGGEVTAFCGETFVPKLRVGSGGKADNPALDICPRCERAKALLLARGKARDEYNRLAREMRALDKEFNEIWAGKPLRVTEGVTA